MTTRKLVGLSAIVAPLLHTASDIVEWMQGGDVGNDGLGHGA